LCVGRYWPQVRGREDDVKGQRWVIAIETKIQLPNTLPIILNCAVGIIN